MGLMGFGFHDDGSVLFCRWVLPPAVLHIVRLRYLLFTVTVPLLPFVYSLPLPAALHACRYRYRALRAGCCTVAVYVPVLPVTVADSLVDKIVRSTHGSAVRWMLVGGWLWLVYTWWRAVASRSPHMRVYLAGATVTRNTAT
jgi:hypothetical protein